jgi:phospholipid/cholesterol/gamma-HCH transport system permease protein
MNPLAALGNFVLLLTRAVTAAFRHPPRPALVIDQLYEVGVRSLSIVTLTAIFTGMVMSLQLGSFLTQFGAKQYVSKVVGVAIVSELGPVLTALMIGGRVGAGMAAELGTMKVTEQIDALRALGTDPIAYLVVPRLLAVVIMLPLLTAMADFIGVIGGLLVAYGELDVAPSFYVNSLIQYLTIADIARSLVKGFFFGIIIAVIACMNGINAEGGADGVGSATTKTVVTASITVLISDFFLTKLMLTW